MDKIGTFEQFLATDSTQFSISDYVINLILTALLAYLLGFLYTRHGNSLSNRKLFSRNFVILSVATMIIITIVKSSLALSLGLVGALSIVRFRSAIKEPEELMYLFLTIAIGLGFGAGQRLATIIGFVFVALLLYMSKLFYKKTNQENQNLLITISSLNPELNQINQIIETLKEYCLKVDMKRFDENENTMEVSFIVETENFNKLNSAKIDIQKRFNNLTISFLDNNIVI